ncbi:hypothetical protein MYIN104542_24985 [Mycobacterium intermedium]
MAELIQRGSLDVVHNVNRGQPPLRIVGHRDQYPLQSRRQIGDVKIRKRLSGAASGEMLLVAGAEEEHAEVAYRPVGGKPRRTRNSGKIQRESGRNEVENYPVGHPPRAAESVALQMVHRKSLMFQRFPYASVNLLAKVGDGGHR